MNRGPAAVSRSGNIARPGGPAGNARVGVGYGRNSYAGWYGRYGRGYYPWRIGFYGIPWFAFFGGPWYGGGGYGGYGGYSTPYYSSYPYDDSIVVETDAEQIDEPLMAPQTESSSGQSDAFLRDAEIAFRDGNIDAAMRLTQHAMVESPEDGHLHLFAAQVLFGAGDYEGAAAEIHHAASLLPENDWGSVVENYQHYYRGRDFVTQMEQLDTFLSEKPDAAYAYFVRGFEHGFLGNQTKALQDLNKAAELEPRDKLAAKLVERFGGTVPAVSQLPESETTPPPAPETTR